MRRLFIHFYIFIALAVIGLGWSLEHILRSEEPQVPEWITPFSQLLIAQAELTTQPQQLSSRVGLPVTTMPATAVAWPEVEQQRLLDGEAIALFNSHQQIFLYLLPYNKPEPMLWRVGPIGEPIAKPTYWYHLLVFALLIGLATFWVWPLARDLLKLERYLGKLPSQQHKPLRLPKQSMITSLADSFNAMQGQIQHLLSLQRELTRAVSHDLRTPLARMKFSLAMQSDTKALDTASLTEDVVEMEQLVETLLEYAKLEGQEKLLQINTVNVGELCQNLVEKLNSMPGLRVKLTARDNLFCPCDGHYIERALQNLIQNARTYAKSAVQVSALIQRNKLYLHVDDDGAGIAEHERQYILQPFVRLDPSRAKDAGGQGLGLAIVARIVEWHQGELCIETSPLGGARFSVVLPCKAS
ncbi:ATP-binding protein [Aliidiomarina quisquiliarum]|uniref:ATP-binding protein n=1 Tax=Aliidiomarina quisquiliarum TaxID=2938947 RepID=UPI00208E336A|nr:ATP-binding protein [Aliidiomarina quisquiliarum]MCO4321212.1 ATP-binding protein [Aliidiomarina quisquiliarum]